MIEIWCLLFLSTFFLLTSAQSPTQDETCDPEFYGRPENQDCKDALARLPDWDLTRSDDDGWEVVPPVREFANAGGIPRIQAPDNRENNIQTPLVYTNGQYKLEED